MQEVEKGVQHIVADRIAKDKDTLCLVREIMYVSYDTSEVIHVVQKTLKYLKGRN